LAKKLGIREHGKILLLHAPENYAATLDPLPPSVEFAEKIDDSIDIVQLFTTSEAELKNTLVKCRSRLRADAMVWVSWPKKSSRIPSEITEDSIRKIALPLGFVDIKVCAVNEIWSGLKLVVRKELR